MRHVLQLLAMLCLTVASGCATPPATDAVRSSGLGVPKADNGVFLGKHEAFLRRGREGPVDLLFIGDSITEGWNNRASALWQQQYGRYRPANFGIGGDRVEHVLWRLDNGELDGIRPAVIVLMIGTNNSASQSGAQIAAGVRQIVALIQQKQPQAKLLLLGVFPRGPRTSPNGKPEDHLARMKVISDLNAELAGMEDGRRVRFLDIGPHFLQDGQIPASVMPDQLHPSLKGYEIWATAMQPLLVQLLEER